MATDETRLAVGDVLIYEGIAIHIKEADSSRVRLKVDAPPGKAPWFTRSPGVAGTVLTFRAKTI